MFKHSNSFCNTHNQYQFLQLFLFLLLAGFAFSSVAKAAEYSKADYSNASVKGKIAVTINYVNQDQYPISAVRIVLDDAPIIINSTTAQVGSIKISLYGIETCSERIDNRDYSGTCEEVAMEIFNDTIKNAHVWICNAYVSEKDKDQQYASCFTRTILPGGIDFRGMLEDELVGLGAHRIILNQDGTPQRPDLVESQETAIANHFQMWNIKK